MEKERKTLGEELFAPVSEETKKKWAEEKARREKEVGEIFLLKKSDPELFRKKFRELFAERLLELLTSPAIGPHYDAADIERIIISIKNGEKIKSDNFIGGGLVLLGQDFRMTHDEIQQPRNEYLE